MSGSSNKTFNLDQLKRMGLLKKASEIKPKETNPDIVIKKDPGFCSLKTLFPDGEFIETPYKQVFKVQKIFNSETEIGVVKINDFFKFLKNFDELLAILQKNENLKNFQFDKLLFFDVESTGLSSGAGNMAFMVGLGFFNEKKDFVIEQYFIEDFINEKGLLYILHDFFKQKYHLISFNGKSFDYYLLKNRFILSRRFTFSLDNLLHFDLLHSGRRMWKNLFSDNSLNNLEKNVLKFFRTEEDIPGFLIPEYYKAYLKTGNAKIVEKIFYHNLMDIRSMLGLLVVQLQNLSEVLDGNFPELINYHSIASIVYNQDKDLSIELLNHVCRNEKHNKHSALKQLCVYYKKDNNKEKFEDTLRQMIEEEEEFSYFPYCELSKYFEHYLKEPKKAIDILNRAMSRIEALSKLTRNDYTKEIDDIIKRLDRIRDKVKK